MGSPANQRKLDVVEELALLAEANGMTLIDMAIAFVINHPGVTSAIVGPRTMEQLRIAAHRRRRHPVGRGVRPDRRARDFRRDPEPGRHQLRPGVTHPVSTPPLIHLPGRRPRPPQGTATSSFRRGRRSDSRWLLALGRPRVTSQRPSATAHRPSRSRFDRES
ncbi:aldo/keto reductase [Frondihabitans sucicola]|uniref:aldo/keto reductase n=1 Tax=Frondihabitans sucicola TaxID=1268041 RepID=UPI002572C90C|nr:aldo/keto reductase [Frondihabitans sucicola]